jgi:hypothetical protein
LGLLLVAEAVALLHPKGLSGPSVRLGYRRRNNLELVYRFAALRGVFASVGLAVQHIELRGKEHGLVPDDVEGHELDNALSVTLIEPSGQRGLIGLGFLLQ